MLRDAIRRGFATQTAPAIFIVLGMMLQRDEAWNIAAECIAGMKEVAFSCEDVDEILPRIEQISVWAVITQKNPMSNEITRTLKMEVHFPSRRKSDFFGEEGVFYEISKAQYDMTRAANKLMSICWGVSQGVIPLPVYEEGHKREGKKRPLKSCLYQALSGKWNPLGEPVYQQSTKRPVSSNILLGTSKHVFQRWTTDAKEVLRGSKSLANFRAPMPFYFTKQGLKLQPSKERFTVPIWAGRKNNKLTLAPRKLRGSAKDIWQRILSDEYQYGGSSFYKSKGKWFVSLSWTGKVKEATGPRVAGLDLGIATTAVIAYQEDGKYLRKRDYVDIPKSTVRAWNRVERERRERGRRLKTKKVEGKGYQRRIRHLDPLKKKRHNLVDSAVKEVSAHIVKRLLQENVSTLVLEDLRGITAQKIDETEHLTAKQRARIRKNFLQWQQHALLTQIESAAESEGIQIVKISPAYTSKMCSACGTVWSTTSKTEVAKKLKKNGKVDKKALKVRSSKGLGRVNQSTFKCDCGKHVKNADYNAARNICRIGTGQVLP